MIDIDECKKTFFEYIKNYDMSDSKINLKVIHTLQVINVAAYIADSLELDEENKNLCLLIALLHDIGRFDQIKIYGTFNDRNSIDHADYGVKILFEDGLIRNYVKSDKYDDIIYYAIKNHNKYTIQEGLTDIQLLHAKIIRDADKVDIFRVEYTEDMNTLLDVSEIELSKDKISEEIYNQFMDHTMIRREKTVTKLDNWILAIAFIFDLNFNSSMKYILDNSYIEKLFDRVEYFDSDTISKISKLKTEALDYAKSKIEGLPV